VSELGHRYDDLPARPIGARALYVRDFSQAKAKSTVLLLSFIATKDINTPFVLATSFTTRDTPNSCFGVAD
jgi:hypothetical protein